MNIPYIVFLVVGLFDTDRDLTLGKTESSSAFVRYGNIASINFSAAPWVWSSLK